MPTSEPTAEQQRAAADKPVQFGNITPSLNNYDGGGVQHRPAPVTSIDDQLNRRRAYLSLLCTAIVFIILLALGLSSEKKHEKEILAQCKREISFLETNRHFNKSFRHV
jgi:hypothetical protein